MSIYVSLPGLVIGALIGAAIQWLATHVSVWFDDGTEEDDETN